MTYRPSAIGCGAFGPLSDASTRQVPENPWCSEDTAFQATIFYLVAIRPMGWLQPKLGYLSFTTVLPSRGGAFLRQAFQQDDVILIRGKQSKRFRNSLAYVFGDKNERCPEEFI